jgi:hypothetical protein
MIFWLTKRFTVALILCLGIMQLLLPFLHTHHDGDVVHAKSEMSLMHVHMMEMNASVRHLPFDTLSDIHTDLVDASFASATVSVDHAVPSQKQMGVFDFIAIVVAMITLFAAAILINYEDSFNFIQDYSNRRPLSRAPPNP